MPLVSMKARVKIGVVVGWGFLFAPSLGAFYEKRAQERETHIYNLIAGKT